MKEDVDIENDDELESQNLRGGSDYVKPYRKPTGDDPISDWLLKTYYSVNSDSMRGFRLGLIASPFLIIFLFSVFVSNSTSNLIAFSAMIIALVFMGISLWILCWILDKDQGSRAMQDVSDPIKEGSEGFFITQYGTIFKLALVCSGLLFLVYM